ncbi:hypothetical protein NQ318_009646 [Aromia moschata]|uniref:acid phosphatase n=1 Tax=Aromia moschata TaxID=1265417 RepID=A0AAV8XYN0_9CUCU|nr:hypothetical protein NQ318_009646 [Aromia moschata]
MKKKCKRYNKELEKVVASDFFVNTNTENAELYEYLSNQTGWDVDDISFVKDLQSIFYADREYNASFVPAWADTLDEDKINYLAGLAFARDTYNTKLKRLRIGPFFYFLLDHFDNVINEDEDTPKFLMLSGHESTVAAVLNGMDAFDYLTPEFASVVIWELKKSENGTHYINMFYKKENSLNSIVINNCYNDCQYEEFKALLEEITVSDSVWEDECGS